MDIVLLSVVSEKDGDMNDQLKKIEEFNEEFTPPSQKTFSSAGIEIAIRYQPTRDFTLHRIDLWTGPILETSSSETLPMLLSVFIRPDDNGRPAQTQLTGGSLELPEGIGWRSIYLDTPIAMKNSTVYWLCYMADIIGFEAEVIEVGSTTSKKFILPPKDRYGFRSPSITTEEVLKRDTFNIRSVQMYSTPDRQSWQGPYPHLPLLRIYGLPSLTLKEEFFNLWDGLSPDQQETMLKVAHYFLNDVEYDDLIDDPMTPEDVAVIKEAQQAYQSGKTLSLDEVIAVLGEVESVRN
jgi:hypothetical protein